jgi:prophage regulatory protein
MAEPELRIIRLPAVADKVGLKRSQIYVLERAGKFPRRVPISDRATGWLEHEIDDFIRARIAASRAA